jgi:gliding motility-associated-like protein
MKKHLLSFLLALSQIVIVNAQNLITNGNFESGGSGVGFQINGSGYVNITPPPAFSGTTSAGNYTFTTNPQPMNISNFISDYDHTFGTAAGLGKMLVIDGNSTGGNQRFWEAGNTGGGVSGLTIGNVYTFTYWIKSVSTNVIDISTSADINVVIVNATNVTLVTGTALAPLPAAGWQKVSYTFKPTATNVNIQLSNNNTSFAGNDFAIDDISLTAPISASFSITNPNTCVGSSTMSAITFTGSGGVAPYTFEYNINGGASQYITSVGAASIATLTLPNSSSGIFTYNLIGVTTALSSATITTAAVVETVNPLNTAVLTSGAGSDNQTVCINSPIATITYTTTGATGATFSGLPPGVTGSWVSNVITISGSSAVSGIIPYTITLTGGCAIPDITGTLNITPINTIVLTSGFGTNNQNVCINTNITTPITFSSVGGTNALFSGLPTGMTGVYAAGGNITINGVPTVAGTYNYNVTLTGGCGVVFFTGKIIVDPVNVFTLTSAVGTNNQTACINNPIKNIKYNNVGNPNITYSWTPTVPAGITVNQIGATILITGTPTVAGVYNYTINGACGGVTVTGTLIVPVNNNTATINAVPLSVCPGNSSVLTITGTPGATYVTITPSGGAQQIVTLNAAGIGTFNTPGLLVDTTYYLNSIVTNPPYCSKDITGQVTVIVNQGGCATSTVAQTGSINTTLIDPICTVGDCRTLNAVISNITPSATPIKETTAYTVTIIPYCPQAQFENPGWTQLYPGNVTGDDKWGNSSFNFPSDFKFCFFGTEYPGALVGTNGCVTFNTALAGTTCPWSFSASVPSTSFPIKNAILGVYQDTDYSVTPTAPAVLSTNYSMSGTYPCRKFIVNFSNLPQFQCDNSVGLQTSQIVLYEISNIIEVYVKRRVPCTGWQNGAGVIGIINNSGSAGYTPPTRNTGNWSATNEAWRFTPNGPNVPVTFQWLQNGLPMVPPQTSTTLTVCPTTTTTYTAEAKYTICNVVKTITKASTIDVNPNLTGNPSNIEVCQPGTIFNLNLNNAAILNGHASVYDVFYYLTLYDAENNTGQNLALPVGAYQSLSDGQTIYASVVHASNCIYVKPFSLIWKDCSLTCPQINTPSPTQSYCVTTPAANPTPFIVNTNGVSGTNSIKFVYFTTPQSGNSMYTGGTLLGYATPSGGTVSYDPPALGLPGSLPNTPNALNIDGTYYVYAILDPPNSDGSCRPFEVIRVNINALPAAPTLTLTQPTCSPTQGCAVITSPLNSPLNATDLFISEVTDANTGSLTYVEIYNATGAAKNLSNYKLKVYNNGSSTASCDLVLSGTIANNATNVIKLSSDANLGGVVPDQAFVLCAGINTDDNIRLTTNTDVVVDNWGRTDGVAFTPGTPPAPGYTYRRNTTAVVPFAGWNAADWTALDPEDYINVGSYYWKNNRYLYSNGGAYTTTLSYCNLAPGNYSMTVKDVATGCISLPTNYTINPNQLNNTINLSSAIGTDSQLICFGNPITNITYVTTGATGATISGLPAGISGSWAGNVYTITGTSTATGVFPYTITLTGGCGTITKTGTITIITINTISLTSAVGTDNQSICISNTLTPITYATVGASGATISGLPAGTTGTWAGNVYTISGTPTTTGIFPYTITLTGGCGIVTKTGTITIGLSNTITLTSPVNSDNQSICLLSTLSTITYSTSNATGATVTGLPNGITGTWAANVFTISGTLNASVIAGTYPYTITLTGGCNGGTISGTITVKVNNTITLSSAINTDNQLICLQGTLTNITYATTSATGATISGLPSGITGTWAGNVFTISGTLNASVVAGAYPYTITMSGGCNAGTISGTINVLAINTITLSSSVGTDNQTVCINSPILNITYNTVGATGATFAGLPTGVTGVWAANVVTISGSPANTSAFTITLLGGCGTVTKTGTITATPNNTVSVASSSQNVCINNAITNITHTTTGATGISFNGVSGANGLPAGISASWTASAGVGAGTITISGTPTSVGIGTFNYVIPLTGGCGLVNATGTIIVRPNNTIILSSAPGTDSQTVCTGTPIVNITYSTSGATGATFTNLPTGVTGSWAADVVTISGSPTTSTSYTIILIGGCGVITKTGTISVNPNNTVSLSSAPSTVNQTVCINTPIVNITYNTTGATGATFAGLPTGVSGSWLGNVITISGSPANTSAYTITLTGGCGIITRSGTITATPNNTASAASSSPSVCIGALMTTITHSTTGATGIGVPTGLPTGITASWSGNVITISGTANPAAPGTFSYSIPLIGNCGTANATGTIIVKPNNTVSVPSSNPTLCINTPLLSNITFATTSAIGIGTPINLPAGLTAVWTAGPAAGDGIITITGTPTSSGVFNYSIPLTGGCGNFSATGRITVIANNTIALSSAPNTDNQRSACIFVPITPITYATTIAAGAFAVNLPPGVTGTWVGNVFTISGVPTTVGTYNYTVTTTGGCSVAAAIGTIIVKPNNTIVLTSLASTINQGRCKGTPIDDIVYTTTGATGVNFAGLPAGITGNFNPATNTITISGSSTVVGVHNYSVTLTGGCGNIVGIGKITIIDAPTIFNPTPLQVCDNDRSGNDGYAFFDLTLKNNEITGGQPFVVHYYETAIDAQSCGTNFITGLYPNLIGRAYRQTLYVCVSNPLAPQCPSYTTLDLIVNPLPMPTPIIPDYLKCDDNVNTGTLAQEIFDLHTMDVPSGMAVGETAYYYLTQADAEAGLVATRLNYLYQNISNPQQIWVRLQNNLTGCFNIRPLNLEIKSLPAIARPIAAYTVCETSTVPDGFELFDLGLKIPTILNGQLGIDVTFHLTNSDALAGIAALPLSYQNVTSGVQTIFVKLKNSLTGCYVISTMDLRVNQLPNPTAPLIPFNTCDADQDGFAFVNLNNYSAAISGNMNVTYYATQTDANSGLAINQLPTPYYAGPFNDFVFVRIEDPITKCYKTLIINLTITPAPLAPIATLLPALKACDDHDANNQDGITNFDLTTNGALLLATQPLAASNYTVTYHTTLADAQSANGNAPIINTSNYLSLPPSPQQIWIRIKHNATGCFNIGTFNLIVDKPLSLTANPVFTMCDNDTNVLPVPSRPFDLTSQKGLVLTGVPAAAQANYSLTYYPGFPVTASSVAISNPNLYDNIANPQTIGIKVTSLDGCVSYTSMTIRVLPIPKPRNLELPRMTMVKCDDINSPNGTELFNLTTNENYIRNADPSLTFEYYPTATDLAAGTNRYTTPTNQEVGTGIVYIKVMSNQTNSAGQKCYAIVEQPIIVNALPAISNHTYAKCIPQTIGGPTVMTGRVFDLTMINPMVLDPSITYNSATTPQLLSNYSFTYTLASGTAITNPTAYANISNPQFITVKVVNKTTDCFSTAVVKLIVELEAAFAAPTLTPLKTCDDDGTNDGKHSFDLSTTNIALYNEILGATPNPNYTVSFFKDEPYLPTSPPVATNEITTPTYTNTVVGGNSIWVVVTNTASTTPCRDKRKLNLVVEQLPVLSLKSTDNNDTVCYNAITNTPISSITLDSGLVAPALTANYNFDWYLGTATTPITGVHTPTINVTVPGDYYVIATSKSPLQGCQSAKVGPFNVKKSSPAPIGNPQYFVSNGFGDNQVITINLIGTGFGSYQYSLDGGLWQSSPVFENVPLTETAHVIEVRDVSNPNFGCPTDPIMNVQTIDYPHFFTPNGDGVNDTWNVSGLVNQPLTKIYIFDRAGKLMKQISTSSNGWDGTFNGFQMPADDYWFTIDFVEQAAPRIFKAHFSLKR